MHPCFCFSFPFCAKSRESLYTKCLKRLSGDGEGSSSGHLLEYPTETFQGLRESLQFVAVKVTAGGRTCRHMRLPLLRLSALCLLLLQFSCPSRPSTLLKDNFWQRIKNKLLSPPYVSQVFHFHLAINIAMDLNLIEYCDGATADLFDSQHS